MDMTRREFLKAGSGLVFSLAISLPAEESNSQVNAKTFNAWVRIAPDGVVTILSAGAEMGQGSMTSLPLILAEEMDADWSKVKIEWAPPEVDKYGYTDPIGKEKLMWIVGSRANQLYYLPLRTAGAQVRKVLIANAAQK